MLSEQLANAKHQVAHLALTLSNTEKERDFYFHKLTEIELLCQQHSNNDIVQQIVAILYKEDDGEEAMPSVSE